MIINYCGFSDDNWMSDVSCYREKTCIIIDVAQERFEDGIPLITVPESDKLWREQYIAQLDWIGTCSKYKPIGLPHGGKRAKCKDTVVALDKLQQLRDVGYIIPQKVFDMLTEELF